jgi:hypothetical protein
MPVEFCSSATRFAAAQRRPLVSCTARALGKARPLAGRWSADTIIAIAMSPGGHRDCRTCPYSNMLVIHAPSIFATRGFPDPSLLAKIFREKIAGTSVLSGNDGRIPGQDRRKVLRRLRDRGSKQNSYAFGSTHLDSRNTGRERQGRSRQGGHRRARLLRWAIRYEKRKSRPEPQERNYAPDRIAVVCDLDGEFQR